jgi:hypothetical protein
VVSQVAFFGSMAASLFVWGIFAAQYIWPALRARPRAEALRPMLILHAFRYMGLAFLVPGVVSPDLPSAFATGAAYGDTIAAVLAVLSLLTLGNPLGIPLAWAFNVWGSLDLLNAFYHANSTGMQPGQLESAYFIPTLVVPLLIVTHYLVFRILLQRQPRP